MPRTDTGPAAGESLRRANTGLVLRALRQHGALSRSRIARHTGLSKATVGTITADLVDLGAVAEGEAESPIGRGRPSTPLQLAGGGHAGLGIEVNVDYIAVTVLDLAGRELRFQEHRATEPAPQLADVVRLVRAELDLLSRRRIEVLGVTLAVPGLIDREAGVVVRAPNLGWTDVALVEAVRKDLGEGARDLLGITVDNDANAAALAESVHGAGVGLSDFIYLTGTVGLGAGMYSHGELLRGARGLAGEIGHVRVGDATTPCPCGRLGCWETQVGLRALAHATGVHPRPGEAPLDYAERVAATPGAGGGLIQFGRSLGRGVSMLVAILDPQRVILGGAFRPLGEYLVPAVQAAIGDGFAESAGQPSADVVVSTLGHHAASIGAAVDALEDVFAGRRLLT